MNIQEYSAVGSPNILLRKNLERGHVYQGLYFINKSLRERFEGYHPVPHFKIHTKLYREVVEGLKDLTRIALSNDESCEMFVDSMSENLGLDGFEEASRFSDCLIVVGQYGATVVYVTNEDIKRLKRYLKAYLKLYEWSRDPRSRTPYYSLDMYLRLKKLISTINEWERFES